MEGFESGERTSTDRDDSCEVERGTLSSFGEGEVPLVGEGCVGRKGEKVAVYDLQRKRGDAND